MGSALLAAEVSSNEMMSKRADSVCVCGWGGKGGIYKGSQFACYRKAAMGSALEAAEVSSSEMMSNSTDSAVVG
jgi:hypothetical protein